MVVVVIVVVVIVVVVVVVVVVVDLSCIMLTVRALLKNCGLPYALQRQPTTGMAVQNN